MSCACASFDTGYGDFDYGSPEKRCARLKQRIVKLKRKRAGTSGRKRRRLTRKINRLKSKYLKHGCKDVTGAGVLSSRKTRKAARAAVQAQAEADALTELEAFDATPATASASNTTTWLIGGVAVVGLLGVVLAMTAPKKGRKAA